MADWAGRRVPGIKNQAAKINRNIPERGLVPFVVPGFFIDQIFKTVLR